MSTEEQENRFLHVAPPTPGRIRSHSLKPQHSRIDYARRKSAADVSSSSVSCLEPSRNDNKLEELPKFPSPSFFKRRFTLFSFDQPQPINEKRRMTTDRLSFLDEKSYSDLLKQKRPSLIAQMLEVELSLLELLININLYFILNLSFFFFQSFVRRISARKKKHTSEREREEGKKLKHEFLF
jgi:hypothetical protein